MASLSLPPCGVKPLSLSINGAQYFSFSSSRRTRSLSVTNRYNASLFFSPTGTSFSQSPMRALETRPNKKQGRRGALVVCEAGAEKKPDSAMKRLRQNAKRHFRNKSRKSEIRTRMRKVNWALGALKKKKAATPEDITAVEKLIALAYSKIDKAVRAGIVHKNKGSHRKSMLARRKRTLLITLGLYTPPPKGPDPPINYIK